MKTMMSRRRTSGKLFFLVAAILLSCYSNAQQDVTRPKVMSVSPGYLNISIDIGTTVSVVFSEAMSASTVNSSTFQLRNMVTGAVIPATVVYNASLKKATLYPTSALTSLLYSVKVKGGSTGVKDLAGNAMLSDFNSAFIMIPLLDMTPPTILSNSPAAGATGVNNGTQVTALFSEAMNASSVNNSTVELRNAANILVPATVSYNSSTRKVTLTPLAPLASSSTYRVTVKGGSSGVKDSRGNGLSANYTWTFSTSAPADATPPLVESVSPDDGAEDISLASSVSVEFNEAMNASSISTTTVQLINSLNNVVPSTISYNAASRTATLTPSSPLAYSNTYTVKVKGGASGVKDVAGNPLSGDFTSTFTTVTVTYNIFDPSIMPDNPAVVDQPVEVGVRFRSSIDGKITGLRFFKGAGNIGTHTGHLWTNAGELLGEVEFVNETASGWQEILFDAPIDISANTTYVASYYSSKGIYAYTNHYFTQPMGTGPLTALADGQDGANGVYQYSGAFVFPTNTYLSTNYFVDVMFIGDTGPDDTAPTVSSISPVSNAVDVDIHAPVTAVFSESMDPLTISSSTVQLKNASNSIISATVTYNAFTHTMKLLPAAPLNYSSIYTVTVKGGSNGASDAAGNSLAADYTWSFITAAPLIAPNEGPGGPILVISDPANPFTRYMAEILRAEGLNEFAVADIGTVTAGSLANYDVAIVGEMPLTGTQVSMLQTWVNNGNTAILMRPAATANELCGLNATTGTLADKYLLVNTQSGPGVGITNQTMQFHGTADLHTVIAGTNTLATLYSNATTATNNPAVTVKNVGTLGGKVYAFTFDLNRSIVYTRQGDPAQAGKKNDGQDGPIRSDDLFFNGWVDFNKIAIPQADEQQRLLANIIVQGNLHKKPLPRFWYLPRDLKAAVVMTGDDHATGGTAGRFEHYKTLGPNSPQDVADWKAIRSTSYIYPNAFLTNVNAEAYEEQGFEIALHPNTGCVNYTYSSLQSVFNGQLGGFQSSYPSVALPVTSRTHCMAWSDWSSTPKVEYENGIRFDVNYYYWPEAWMHNTPGMFTGSGLPMRFADIDGSIIDVYQAPTQMTDETNMNYTAFCNAVLDKAVGPEGYYGVFTANMHTDNVQSAGSDAILASALARQVPVISARQMLTWLDARNRSAFGNMSWQSNKLTFTASAPATARNLRAMLPVASENGQLVSIKMNGAGLPFVKQTIKGVEYAFFTVATGTNNYVAEYGNVLVRTSDVKDSTVVTVGGESGNEEAGKTNANSEVKTADEPIPGLPALLARVVPNPSSSFFSIVYAGNGANPVTIRILDMNGRVVESYQQRASTGILQVGQNWGAGYYFAEILQGTERKVIKLVKVN